MKLKDSKIKINEKVRNRKFILLVGEEGAILIYIVNNKLFERLYSTLSSKEDLSKIENLLSVNPNVDISLLVDTSDQTYTQQNLPGTNSFILNKLIQRKLNKDFSTYELRNSIRLGRTKSRRNDWNVVLVGCSISPPLSQWMEFVSTQNNIVKGIYLLPVEAGLLVKKLNDTILDDKNSFKFAKKDKASKLQLLVVNDKVSGFRQVLYSDSKAVFTRLISVQQDESISYITGNIEQEITNTIEYLKRLNLKDKGELEIIIIVSKEIKNILQTTRIQVKKILIFTPYELANKIGLSNVGLEEDKYFDAVACLNFSNSKPILHFITNPLNDILKYTNFIRLSYLSAISILIIGLSILMYNGVSVFSSQKSFKEKTLDKNKTDKELIILKDKAGNLGEISKMTDMTNLYSFLIKNNISPLTIIERFARTKKEEFSVKSISWQLKETVNSDKQSNKESFAVFEGEFSNNRIGYQNLFEDFDNFIKKIESDFKDYNVEYTRNTEKINFDDTVKKIPLKITISGPKNNIDRGK